MITTENNYEYITFHQNGKMLKNISEVEINGRVFDVQPTQTSRSYPDHGKIYTSTFPDYKIKIQVQGVEFETTLSELIERKKTVVVFVK